MSEKYTVIVTNIHDQLVAQIFRCDQADDETHAREQAEDAYPECRVNAVFQSEDPGWLQIYSPNESATSSGAGFWSNEDGWSEEGGETLFDIHECMETVLPLSLGNDAIWRFVHEKNASQVSVANRIRDDYLKGKLQSDDEVVKILLEKCRSVLPAEDSALAFLAEKSKDELQQFDVGGQVYWEDPDAGLSSGYYTIKKISGDVILIADHAGSEVEVFAHEIR